MDWVIIIFMGLILIGVFALLIVLGIAIDKGEKANKGVKSIEEQLEDADYEKVELKARVVDLSCSAELVGIKKPKAENYYWAVFEGDDGKSYKLSVTEEMYDGFEEGQEGVLTLVDGELYGFEINEYS